MPQRRQPLPIDDYRDAILHALRLHPVVIVAGDTGSGKTTQIPQYCLDLGIPETKQIACTQPRRVAAVSVAERVAQERGTAIGTEIGWQHRFGRCLSEHTRVKFMTDGILLAETRGDPQLRRYAVVMVDEAHERTLNIDFLLGYLKRLLPRRPELRVVVSSATLDVARFREFFGGAPVVEVPGRVFPVETRWRPCDDEDADLARRVADGVEELWTSADGDILVFLPGERDIREAEETVRALELPDTDVLPFMASLPPADQRRVFHPVAGRRRVVLSTNVAETSLTIPGIRMVVDSGLARINRFNARSGVERLHIENISQASANQRKGRCGRVGPGICLRLYGEEDFASRPEYTEPELRRSSLGGVILSMADLRLGPIEEFPFLDPPASGAIREGYRELHELGALDERSRLTSLGRQLVRFPVEPRFARMLVAADEEKTMRDALTVVAALATEDPRLRPLDHREEADKCHAPFRAQGSDFDSILRLWRWFQDLPSRTAQRKKCKENYLSFRRFQEWSDVREQLRRTVVRLGIEPEQRPSAANSELRTANCKLRTANTAEGVSAPLHRALLSGLLSHIGRRDPEEGDYRGANGLRFAIHPGSVLAKKQPDWVMAAELVDTSRLFARRVAAIDPEWIEPVAGPLCKHAYHSPFWDERVGTARALERVLLHGLVIADGRRRDFSRIDPAMAREMLVRHGLVGGALPPGGAPPLVRANLALFESIRDRHRKLREAEDMDDEAFISLYLERLPESCVNLAALRQCLHRAPKSLVESLTFRREDFAAPDEEAGDFPALLRLDGHVLRLAYRNDPGAEDDGITCTLPLDAIPSLRRWPHDWLVPGALPQKLAWMLSRIPRAAWRNKKGGASRPGEPPPAPEKLPALLGAPDRPLDQALRALLRERWGVAVPDDAWDPAAMPPHLRVRFRVLDDEHRECFVTRDPAELAAFEREFRRLSTPAELPTCATAPSRGCASSPPLRDWTCGPLPDMAEVPGAGAWALRNIPALTDEDGEVRLRWYADRAEAAAAHRDGVRRLYAIVLGRDLERLAGPPRKVLMAELSSANPFAALPTCAAAPSRGCAVKPEDAALAAIDAVLLPPGEPLPRDAETFHARLRERRSALAATAREQFALADGALALADERRAALDEWPYPEGTDSDIREQLDWLLFPGFARLLPPERLRHYGRYLEALRLRLERARQDPARDLARMALVRAPWERYLAESERPGATPARTAALAAVRWAIEEYRVSVFAQELRTPEPVSPQRIDRLFAAANAC